MDEKTAELRDIFVSTTGADTVTERQEESRGSLTADERQVDDRLAELVATMRDRYEFRTELDNDALVALVREFFADGSVDPADRPDDEALAAALGLDAATVSAARLDLHLVRPADREGLGVSGVAVEFDDLRRLVVEGADDDAVAAALGGEDGRDDVDEATVARVRRVVEADVASTRANDRFRDGFEELLTDSELTRQHARDAREDGLREATEDIETDVSF
jgi:hypothetical protein